MFRGDVKAKSGLYKNSERDDLKPSQKKRVQPRYVRKASQDLKTLVYLYGREALQDTEMLETEWG